MKITKKHIIVIGSVIILAIVIFILRSPEDSWIKNNSGLWIKHGSPSNIPNEVSNQQEVIICALQLYQQAKQKGIKFTSQCLGKCGDYSVDIVNIPRTEEDNLEKNQCQDYPEKTSYFIELDKEGNIFRII